MEKTQKRLEKNIEGERLKRYREVATQEAKLRIYDRLTNNKESIEKYMEERYWWYGSKGYERLMTIIRTGNKKEVQNARLIMFCKLTYKRIIITLGYYMYRIKLFLNL